MKKSDSLAAPDFHVRWRNQSASFSEDVYCEPASVPSAVQSKLRDAIATVKTDTTHIEVSEVNFTYPIVLTFTPHRPGFCLLSLATSATTIDYGYQGGDLQSAKLENVLLCCRETRYQAAVPQALSALSPVHSIQILQKASWARWRIFLRRNWRALEGPLL